MTEPVARRFSGKRLFLYEEENLVFGYTTIDFSSAALKALFPGQPLLFLRQVHGERILGEGEWRPAGEADGLLVERGGGVAVIQTADCLPLFFFDDGRRRGGVLHVGWRGLRHGIEERLAARLGSALSSYSFFLGPGIERDCYEVGEELRQQFSEKAYAKEIFATVRPGKLRLDLKAGLKSSLRALGVPRERIGDCGLCTSCSRLFPSYRRDGASGRRIFNFLALGPRRLAVAAAGSETSSRPLP